MACRERIVDLTGRTLRLFAYVAVYGVSFLSAQFTYAKSSDDDEAVRICDRKEWRTKGCRALKESMVRASQSVAEAAHYRDIGSKNDQLYTFLIDRGALHPDPQKKKVRYDATGIGQTASWIAQESGKLPKDDPARGISSLLLTAYKQKIDPKFAPAIP